MVSGPRQIRLHGNCHRSTGCPGSFVKLSLNGFVQYIKPTCLGLGRNLAVLIVQKEEVVVWLSAMALISRALEPEVTCLWIERVPKAVVQCNHTKLRK
ncbi:hypothetical protein Ldro_1578 [Legionella drozanskii LLAP-1]|uniref:Uncharacterized protein n=1 Tax=Legionella drozanskii LLAP-1 TaxID=1212489 RepID=A0A0W0SX69_9GAMM|nr:hypothetical protein Ldro_1578 [Legionella drozanskii LLAP-1]PJE08302.1 MAG: hypothetical protein CK430_12630 [Legionella sp.]